MSAADAPGPGIVYDLTRLVKRAGARTPTGIDRVDLRYALRAAAGEWGPALPALQLGGEMIAVPHSAARRLLAHLSSCWLEGGASEPAIEMLLRDAGLAEPVPASRRLAGAKAVQTFALQHDRAFYLNVSHHGLGEGEMLARLHARLGGGCVFFVHDLIPIEYPEYVRPGDQQRHAARMATVLTLASLVIVNSEATRRSLENWAERNGYAPPLCQVAHIGIEPGFEQPAPADLPPIETPYFVYVSTIEPRKNHVTLLHLWRDMARKLPAERVPKLVLIGRRGWECEHVFALLDRCDLLQPHVIELSHLDDATMLRWLRGARAALFPSFAEGWGMPVVEALSLGVPVICSRIPAFEEATQGLGEMLDPLDVPAWHDRILAYASEPADARSTRQARLRDFARPQWASHFAAVQAAVAARDGKRLPTTRLPEAWQLAGPEVTRPGLDADPTFGSYADAVLAGDMRRDAKDWAAAARAYRRALELQPDEGHIWVQLGHMAKEAGASQLAYNAYSEALRLLPDDADLHLQFGHFFRTIRQTPQALAYYEAALLLDPHSEDARRHVDGVRAELLNHPPMAARVPA
ncbi:glycosyltransferase family 1 protein [Roseicella sp. DB1501]|uniref:glycosyltransferase family 4 protein n=1 Tax=Roseicella sp. DB1501 TaxID=2730925 RepID=UPI001491F62E|nr:glycosyltransferase family 1 protein [Roseicella sp. DB1501]NOG72689.1 glycosyltransferase [Roseicella sp. DB1501]